MRLTITSENIVLPWKTYLDIEASNIPFATEVSETTDTILGIDGAILLSNKYEPKTFTLAMRSWEGTTRDEKDMLLRQLNRYWVRAKEQDGQLYWHRTKRMYSVRSVGMLERPREHAGFIDFTLPLIAHDPIGYSVNESKMTTTGIFNNQSNTPAHTRLEFIGPVTNPGVVINAMAFQYVGTVTAGNKLVVDSRSYTAKIVNITTNFAIDVTMNWNDNFPVLRIGSSEINEIRNAVGKATLFWRNGWV